MFFNSSLMLRVTCLKPVIGTFEKEHAYQQEQKTDKAKIAEHHNKIPRKKNDQQYFYKIFLRDQF